MASNMLETHQAFLNKQQDIQQANFKLQQTGPTCGEPVPIVSNTTRQTLQ
jgi:hypothetical protein